MKRLLKYLRGYTKEAILGPLFKLLEATLELIVPLVIADIIDNGIGASDYGYVLRMCGLLLLLGAVGLIFSCTAQYYAAKASVGAIAKLRYSLFEHMGRFSYSELDSIGTSTMITRMTADTNQVQTGINLTLRLLLRSPFVVFGAMIMAFTIDFKSALIFCAVIPILAAVVFGIMLICIPLYKKVQGRVDKVVLKTRENLSGARVVRAFTKEGGERSDFNEKNESLSKMQKFVGSISALMNPMTYVIINVAIIVLIYTGALRVDSGDLTSGQVVALYNYMSQILVELIKLANLIITITKAVASAGRISAVFEIHSSIKEGERDESAGGEVAVEFKNVGITYLTAKEPSLSNISFRAKKGERIGIIGGTGSGKTTLVNLIPRFYDATEGEVLIDGAPIKEYTNAFLRKKIAVVPQKAVLFAGTVRDNLKWGNEDATDEQLYDALKAAQALETVEERGGLDAKVEQGGKNLSGGQRQRLTIARALVANPEILILDDSSSALDFATDKKVRAAIKNLSSELTVFTVSQRAYSIMHSDRIIVLDEGAAVGVGTHEQLLESSAVYREIYESQFPREDE